MNVKVFTPIQISISIHLSIFLIGASVFVFRLVKFPSQSIVPLTVIEEPIIVPSNLVLQPPKEVVPPKEILKPVETQKVFGVSRKAITAAASDESAISVKKGNTVVKEQDDLVLKDTDADSLPIPADDFLVTQNVKLIFSPKAQRTEEARKEGYTGDAQLSLLVDKDGIVRNVQLLNELKFGLGERAIEIAKQLKFSPAQVKGEPVAVRIKFVILFKSGS